MLLNAHMKRAALAVILLAMSSGVASAGGYLGLGIGTAPAVSTGIEGQVVSPDGRSARLMLGSRFGQFSVEGALGGFDAVLSDSRGAIAYDVYQASIAGKLSLPLGNNFEAFGRVGLQKSWWTTERPELEVGGSGLLFGAGFEYRIKTVAGQGSVFVDYQYSSAELKAERSTLGDTSMRMWTLGLTIGI